MFESIYNMWFYNLEDSLDCKMIMFLFLCWWRWYYLLSQPFNKCMHIFNKPNLNIIKSQQTTSIDIKELDPRWGDPNKETQKLYSVAIRNCFANAMEFFNFFYSFVQCFLLSSYVKTKCTVNDSYIQKHLMMINQKSLVSVEF